MNNRFNEENMPIDSIFGLVYNKDFDGLYNWEIKNGQSTQIYLDIFDIMFALTVNNKSLEDNVCHLVAKAIILREIKGIDLIDIAKILAFMKIEKLNIVCIKDSQDKVNIIRYDKPSVINYIEISVENFISHIEREEFDLLDNNLNTLYILRGGSFIDIKQLFSKINGYNINVSKGGSQKSHMLSPLDFRLSTYLMAMFNLDFKYIAYLNTFNDMPRYRYLPYQEKPVEVATVDKNNKLIRKLVSKSTLLNTDSVNKKSFNNGNSRSFHTSTWMMNKNNETPIFSYLDRIAEIVDNSDSLYEAQHKIEISWIELMKERLEDPNISSWQMLPILIKKASETLEKAEAKGILKKRFKTFSTEISDNKKEILILTIGVLISNYYRMSKTNLCIQLGNDIAFLLFKKGLTNKEINLSKKFLEWKKIKDLDNTGKLFKLGDYFVLIFTNEPTPLFEVEFNDDDFDTSSDETLKVSAEYIEIIKDTLYVHPTSLPMLSTPLEWSEEEYGGFIQNQYDQDTINTGSSYHGHKLDNKESLYKAVNLLNKTEFSVNRELYDYITNEGKFLLECSNDKKAFQTNITLKVANIYSRFKFYLNLNCDWRGRLYTNSFFLSYQGGDLSRSLIQFANGEKLTEEGLKYLYICCANSFSSELSKKSFSSRITWVKKNLSKIITLDKDFILKSSKKIQFASFCLTLKNYNEDKNYSVNLPVFLDATCSGMQHLSAILQDINMASHVNLISKDENDQVGDLYGSVVKPINKAINKEGRVDPVYKALKNVELTRQILKPSIMTQVYAVTVYGIFRQLKSQLKKEKVINPTEKTKDGKEKYQNFYWVPTTKGKDILLSYSDIYKMAEIIKNQPFTVFPPLKEIYNYFIESSKLMIKLNLPIVWFTPAGLEITQFYYQSITKKVQLSSFGKTKTRVFREWKLILDKVKTSQSIIPNIIHSLDASHLINVINSSYAKNTSPIISVHDCFGTHPNKMDKLAKIVRSEFALLYTQENFLEKYNERMINSIIDNNYEIINKKDVEYVCYYETLEKDGKKYLSQKKKLYEIPKLPKMGSLDLRKIIDAIYLVC